MIKILQPPLNFKYQKGKCESLNIENKPKNWKKTILVEFLHKDKHKSLTANGFPENL